jgi:hypothetical protein
VYLRYLSAALSLSTLPPVISEVLELGAGGKLERVFETANGLLTPQIELMAYHDFANDPIEANATFLAGGTSFVAQGATPHAPATMPNWD